MARAATATPEAFLRRQLREQLWDCERADQEGLVYRGPADFVLRHGRVFRPSRFNHRPGAPHACFGNAIALAEVTGLRYVEGYATDPGRLRAAIHHAWNLTVQGELVDSTWKNEGIIYLGVEFSLGRADDATWNGDASILDDYNRGWPLLREPWTGEDFARAWEPSEMRVAILSGDERAVRTLMASARVEAEGRCSPRLESPR